MVKANRSYVLLLSLFTFSFAFRMVLMLWSGFPPGADIGLHNSVIYSITGSGNVDFFYNFYHIGGGLSLTFPGYHIFTAGVMLFTGLPEYVAQPAVVALFSSLIVVCTFLITKKVFSTSAAYIVAFLAAISRFDIEMLMWAGYPNVITLMLIPLTFYLYLERERFSKVPFYVSTSVLAGAIFLTHSLSAVMFVGLSAVIVLAVLVVPKKLNAPRRSVLNWILPAVFGALLVSPFLVQAIPTYLANYGSSEINNAAFSRILDYWIVIPLFGVVAALVAFSKKYYNKFLALPTFLLAIWVFVPLMLTQAYLVGLPVDYNRFLYFLILPVLVFIAVLIDHGSETIANGVETYRTWRSQTQTPKPIVNLKLWRLSKALTGKKLYSILVLVFLVFSFVAIPIFTTPSSGVGQSLQNYYQTMDQPKWEATQWIKDNTAPGSVLVADAWYGWWLGGFTQRPTLSAVDPAYLTVSREVDNATFASRIIDTDFVLDNNYTQIREDGYLSRHNPEILVKPNWTYSPYSFFNFNNNGTSIEYAIDGVDQPSVWVNDLAIKDIRMVNDTQYASVIVTRGNDDFNYTVSTTIYSAVRFVNITASLTGLREGLTFDRVHMNVETNGLQVSYGNDLATIGIVDVGTKSLGQLIFTSTPESVYMTRLSDETVKTIELTYSLGQKADSQFQMLAYAEAEDNNQGIYSGQTSIDNYFIPVVARNLGSALDKMEIDYGWNNFDYRSEILNRSVSYIVLAIGQNAIPEKTEAAVNPKFYNDDLFSLVFINEEVAIYRVNV